MRMMTMVMIMLIVMVMLMVMVMMMIYTNDRHLTFGEMLFVEHAG